MTNLPDRAQDAIELAWTLLGLQDDISLAEVDGAFYWYVCQRDAWDQIEEFARQNEEATDEELRLLFRLESRLPGAAEVLENNVYPSLRGAVYRWMFSSSPLRVPTFSSSRLAGGGLWLVLGVTNGAWTGADVGREASGRMDQLRQHSPETLNHFGADAGRGFLGTHFQFYEADTFRLANPDEIRQDLHSADWILESPVVTCAIHFPFPPEELIAAAYDEIVIKREKWNEQLYGFGVPTQQEIRTAIRTWAIGILIGSGLSERQAIQQVFQDLEFAGGLSGPQWSNDRRTLLARVPEARPFVYSPKRKPKALPQQPT